MVTSDYQIVLEQERHQGGVRTLLSKAFGPGRMMRAIYRMRAAIPPDPALCFVMVNKHDMVLGVVRNYRVCVGNSSARAVLLGPIATAASHGRIGIAAQLMHHAIAAIRAAGFDMIYLVGDPDYYGEFGFMPDGGVHIRELEAGKVILSLAVTADALPTGEIKMDDQILLEQSQRRD